MSKIISILNLKGGVGKSISAINIAYILSADHGQRVLLVDNDKQGNTSKFYGAYDPYDRGISDALTVRGYQIRAAIKSTQYERLDVLPANMNLVRANQEILLDVSRAQQTRMRDALAQVAEKYDYIIVDNAPDFGMNVINAIVASNDVMIPIMIDQFAFDGIELILGEIEKLRDFNPGIRIAGGFVTRLQKNNANESGVRYLHMKPLIPMFDTMIRASVSVVESTFKRVPLPLHAKNSLPAKDYRALVSEYLEACMQ